MVDDDDCCAVGYGFEFWRGMHVCKCVVLSRHKVTLSSSRAANPLVGLVGKEERWEEPEHPRVFSLKTQNEPTTNRFVPCVVLQRYG
ncbi:hypothetical protein TNCV_3529681 [Trichonephila clavipes]|uniref:Uncharacterized protein n=1 Tax=Trichonephila clavipes TaxID=2585209 RepID=A0A8X6V3F6_TRICX|nr:hypothetical protein TNCV_3529681 [Trichonephila clavipes]